MKKTAKMFRDLLRSIKRIKTRLLFTMLVIFILSVQTLWFSVKQTGMYISCNQQTVPGPLADHYSFRDYYLPQTHNQWMMDAQELGDRYDQNDLRAINNSTNEHLRKCIKQMTPWEKRNLLNSTDKPRYLAFRPTMTSTEYRKLMEVFNAFLSVCEFYGLQYFLYGGSWIGALRHAGLVPWDDDIDVFMNVSQQPDIIRLLGNVSAHELYISEQTTFQWKFYKANGIRSSLPTTHWNWPHIDIFFFDENVTHIWDRAITDKGSAWYGDTQLSFKKELIFPLVRNRFECFIPFVPRCLRSVTSQLYDVTLCQTSSFSHKRNAVSDTRTISIPCKRLYEYFLFRVNMTRRGDYIKRSLQIGTDEQSKWWESGTLC